MKPLGSSGSRSGTVKVVQVNLAVMRRARQLARRPGARMRVVDSRTVVVENVSPWEGDRMRRSLPRI